MDELYHNLSELNNLQWDKAVSSNAKIFQATEIWLTHASGKTTARTIDVSVTQTEAWLRGDLHEVENTGASLIARFVWIEIDDKKCVNVPHHVTANLIKRFGLELAYNYSISRISGIAALPRHYGADSESQAYSFCYIPKLAAVWSHTQFRPPMEQETATAGIILCTRDYKKPLRKALEKQWSYGISAHSMFLPLCIAISFGKQVDDIHETIKDSLRDIEERTGYHGFQRRESSEQPNAPDLTEELGQLSQDSNASATKLASVGRKTKLTGRLLQFILKNVEEEEARRVGQPALPADGRVRETQTGQSLFQSYVAILEDRLNTQEVDIEYTTKRLDVQINTLFHLVTWNDSLLNLQLSKSTHEIAEASYRDASSMKTLAVVTMLFLPGSFVSSLFSTDVFDWDSRDLLSSDISVKTTPQLQLYWAITIPLTVMTFVAYFAWLLYVRWKREQRNEMNPPQTPVMSSDYGGKKASIAMQLTTKRRQSRLNKTGSESFD